MNYYDQVLDIYKEAILKLKSEMKEGMKIKLIPEIEDEEGDYPDEFYELCTQFLMSKYGYALTYYLYEAYMEDGKIYFK